MNRLEERESCRGKVNFVACAIGDKGRNLARIDRTALHISVLAREIRTVIVQGEEITVRHRAGIGYCADRLKAAVDDRGERELVARGSARTIVRAVRAA